MKKIMTLVLISAFLLCTVIPVFANGQKEVAAEAVTLSVQVESGWLEYYDTAIQRVLARYPNASFEIIETGAFDHLDVLDSTDATNPDVADIFAFPADRVYGLSENDVLAAMDAKAMAANVGGFGDYDAGLGGAFRIDGDYLGFPMNIETLVNFVNTVNAQALGINLNNSIEFTDLAPTAMLVPVFNAWFGVAMTNAADIEYLGVDNNGNFYSDLTKDFSALPRKAQDNFRALFNYWQAHDRANTPLWDSGSAWGYMDEEFAPGGDCAIRLEGPWSTGNLTGHAGAENLAIIPTTQVTINGQPMAHWKGGWALGINARAEDNDAKMAVAQALIEEIVNIDYAVEYYADLGKIMAHVDPSVYANSNLDAIDKVVIASVLESYAAAPARPLFSQWGQVWGTWETGMLSWAAVKPTTVEQAYAEIQASFKAMMQNF